MEDKKRELLKQQLESLLSKAYEESRRFSELGRVGEKVVKKLDKDISAALAVLNEFDKSDIVLIKSVIKQLS